MSPFRNPDPPLFYADDEPTKPTNVGQKNMVVPESGEAPTNQVFYSSTRTGPRGVSDRIGMPIKYFYVDNTVLT